jgi:hypothetical protein
MDRPLVPFDGKIVVFGGDFRQVLPVVVHGSQSQIEGACLKMSSTIWYKVKTLKLTRNMRVKSDETSPFSFVDFLLHVGEGKEQTFSFDDCDDYTRITDHILFTPHGRNLNNEHEIQLIPTIYPNISNGNFAPQDIKRTAILTTLHKDVNHMNDLATTLFPGEATEYLGQDSVQDSDTNGVANYPTEYLNSLDPTGLSPYKLVLKVGMPIILLRNVDQKKRTLQRNSLDRAPPQATLHHGNNPNGTFCHRLGLHSTSAGFNNRRQVLPDHIQETTIPGPAHLCHDDQQVPGADSRKCRTLSPYSCVYTWSALCRSFPMHR